MILVVCRGNSYFLESEMRKGNIDANQWKEIWFRSWKGGIFTFVLFDGLTIRQDLSNSLHKRVETAQVMPELVLVGDHEEIQRLGFLWESGSKEQCINRCEGVSKVSGANKISPWMLSSLRESGRGGNP